MADNTYLLAILLPAIVNFGGRALIWFDLLFRIYLAERNRSSNTHRLSQKIDAETKQADAPAAVACLVGYREEANLFEAALTSYLNAGQKYLVVGIDGDSREDDEMVHIFQKVVGASRKTIVMDLNICVGQAFMEQLETEKPMSLLMNREPNRPQDGPAFNKGYEYMLSELSSSGFLETIKNSNEDFAICFTQPHRDLKEVRLAGWILSIVVADLKNIEYLWSSDSDTIILPDTIPSLTKIVSAEPGAAGASALVQLNNGHVSFISRMAQTAFNCDAILNRSALGALGRSECLNGPGSLFRITALRTVAASWYTCQYPGSQYRTVLNEDMQVTMLLGKAGWCRLYSEQSIIETAGPTSLKGWVGQRIRWSRGIHLHRVHDYRYIMSQGLLYTAYMVRSALYDPLLLMWISYFAITGRQLIKISIPDVLVLEIIPPLYNHFKSRRPKAGMFSTLVHYLSYRAISPAYRMYTFLTPGKNSWALPSTQSTQFFSRLKSFDLEMGFVFLWFFVLASAGGRALLVLGSGY